MKPFLWKIIGVLLSFLVAGLLAEGAVRLLAPQEVGPVRFACDPELGEIPVPGQRGVRNFPGVFTFRYSNNSLGWRGSREYRPEKSASYRVLVLGDSFTYGIGVNDDQTFAARMENHLAAEHLDVEVMNAGCPGKGTDYALKVFQRLGRKFHPDLTVLCFFCNDFQDNERGEYYNIGKSGDLVVNPQNCHRGGVKTVLAHLPGYNWLISWSQAANLVKQAGVQWLVQGATPGKAEPAPGLVVSYQRDAEGYANQANTQITAIYLEQLQAAVQQAGGALMICYIPISQEVNEFRRTQRVSADEAAVGRLAAALGLQFWSLPPLLARAGQPLERFYYQEGHWTAAAHELAAQYLSGPVQGRLTAGRPE
jgi:hypothetical protein